MVIKSVPLTLGDAANSPAWGTALGVGQSTACLLQVVMVIIAPGIFFWATRGVCAHHSEAGFTAEVRWRVNAEAPGESNLRTVDVGAGGTGFPLRPGSSEITVLEDLPGPSTNACSHTVCLLTPGLLDKPWGPPAALTAR